MREDRLKRTTSIVTIIIALISVVSTAILGYIRLSNPLQVIVEATQTAEAKSTALAQVNAFTPSPTPSPTGTLQITNTPAPQSLETQVAMLQGQVATLEYMATQQIVNRNYDSQIAALNNNQNSLSERLAIIEQAVLDNPGKSLELTLMRKEIDDIKETNKSDTERMLKDIDRVYNQNNWFVGLMFSLALGLVSLAISNYIKRPEKSDENKNENTKKKN